jgi:hypothetical protein
MDKKIAGVLAAIGVAVPMGAAQAAVTPAEVNQAMNATSFAELLNPVPNAAAILKAIDENPSAGTPAGVELAQYHHHHHRDWRWYHHHHWQQHNHHWFRHHHHHHWW